MGVSNDNDMRIEGADDTVTAAVVHDRVPEGKKIELKFNSMSAARVKKMAAATCGVFEPVTLIVTTEQKLMEWIRQLEYGNEHVVTMTQAGTVYLSNIQQAMSDLDSEMLKLEAAGKPSIFSRILGKGVAPQGTIDALKRMVDVCDQSVMQLREHSEKLRMEIHYTLKLCNHATKQAQELETDVGRNLCARVSNLSDKFRDRCKSGEDLLKASEQMTHDSIEMRDRAGKLVDKHKAFLHGKAAP